MPIITADEFTTRGVMTGPAAAVWTSLLGTGGVFTTPDNVGGTLVNGKPATAAEVNEPKSTKPATESEVLDVQFEPIRQGKNIVRVNVRNDSDDEQVFAIHIYTRSPDYGKKGVGWGTVFFETIEPNATKACRFAYKIQGPVTENTWLKLKFYNPESVEANLDSKQREPFFEKKSKALLFEFSGFDNLSANSFNGGIGGKYFIKSNMAIRGGLQFVNINEDIPFQGTGGIDGEAQAVQSISPLAAGESRGFYFSYKFTCETGTSHTWSVVADAKNDIDESDESNNSRTEKFTCSK